jgi:hypothetical protein
VPGVAQRGRQRRVVWRRVEPEALAGQPVAAAVRLAVRDDDPGQVTRGLDGQPDADEAGPAASARCTPDAYQPGGDGPGQLASGQSGRFASRSATGEA